MPACLAKTANITAAITKTKMSLNLVKSTPLIPICPETFSGLPSPRMPSEIKDGKVYSKNGEDLTDFFFDGAEKSLYIAEETGCQIAVLKERSPSCGFGKIYDGTFTGNLTYGNGITAQMLYEHGIRIFGESKINNLPIDE